MNCLGNAKETFGVFMSGTQVIPIELGKPVCGVTQGFEAHDIEDDMLHGIICEGRGPRR